MSGRTVVVAGDFPGPTLFDGNGTVRLYIDDRASANQQRELEAVFSGAKGGPMGVLAGLVTKVLPTKAARINVREEGGNLTVTVSNFGVIKSQPMKDEAGRPTSLQNAMLAEHLQLGDIQVAPSGHRWSDQDMPSRLMKNGECRGAKPLCQSFRGRMRVSLRYKFFPLPGEEGGQGDGRKGFSTPC